MLGDELELVVLLLFFHELHSVLGRELKALERQVLLDDLLHLGLDLHEIVRGERLLKVDVIVEAVFNGRADGEFRAGIQSPDSLGHDVGGGVPVGVLAFGGVEGQNFEGAVLCQRRAQIRGLPVNFAGTGGLVQARADGFGDFGGGDPCLELLCVALQHYLNHA